MRAASIKTIPVKNYEFSLGLNGLGTCATQYSSEYMDVTVVRDGFEYRLHFEKGENKTDAKEGFIKKPTTAKKTGTTIRWKPDLEVFTDINIPVDYYLDTLKRQAGCQQAISNSCCAIRSAASLKRQSSSIKTELWIMSPSLWVKTR